MSTHMNQMPQASDDANVTAAAQGSLPISCICGQQAGQSHEGSLSQAASDALTSAQPVLDLPDHEWCGWHTDFCSLTGLTAAMYWQDGREVVAPDPEVGLYVRARNGEVVKVLIPEEDIAFQVGTGVAEGV